MADESAPAVWGLWNERLGEWLNPGTRKPYYLTAEEARRTIPKAVRQYPFGMWEVREYPLDDQDDELEEQEAPQDEPAAPGRAAPARSRTAPQVTP